MSEQQQDELAVALGLTRATAQHAIHTVRVIPLVSISPTEEAWFGTPRGESTPVACRAQPRAAATSSTPPRASAWPPVSSPCLSYLSEGSPSTPSSDYVPSTPGLDLGNILKPVFFGFHLTHTPTGRTWDVEKRYSNCVALNKALSTALGLGHRDACDKLPPKRRLGLDNRNRAALASRAAGLQEWATALLALPPLAEVTAFFELEPQVSGSKQGRKQVSRPLGVRIGGPIAEVCSVLAV